MTRSLAYFGIVFGMGFVLGPVRVLWLVPRVGERWAELIEAPVMLTVIVLAARWLVRRFPADRRISYLWWGLGALALVIAAELTVVLALRGLTLSEYLTTRDPVAGGVYLANLALFAIMPWFLAGRRAEHG